MSWDADLFAGWILHSRTAAEFNSVASDELSGGSILGELWNYAASRFWYEGFKRREGITIDSRRKAGMFHIV